MRWRDDPRNTHHNRIAFWDERLSTVSVEEFVGETVGKRKTRVNAKASGLIDKLAAQMILQGAVDYMDMN